MDVWTFRKKKVYLHVLIETNLLETNGTSVVPKMKFLKREYSGYAETVVNLPRNQKFTFLKNYHTKF